MRVGGECTHARRGQASYVVQSGAAGREVRGGAGDLGSAQAGQSTKLVKADLALFCADRGAARSTYAHSYKASAVMSMEARAALSVREALHFECWRGRAPEIVTS